MRDRRDERDGRRFEVFGTSNPELQAVPFSRCSRFTVRPFDKCAKTIALPFPRLNTW